MASLSELKRKIKIIESTKKITNAMKLVATSKMKKYKNFMISTRDFCGNFYDIFSFIDINAPKYFEANKSQKVLWIIFESTMGLCGSFNLNVIKLLKENIKDDDLILLIGRKGYQIINTKIKNFKLYLNIDVEEKDMKFSLFLEMANLIFDDYNKNLFGEIKIIYTQFINSISFENKIFNLIPIDKNIDSRLEKPMDGSYFLIEPNRENLFKIYLPLYFAVSMYGSYIESKVCENSSRRNAMDSATKNANDLSNSYKIKYNSVRQAKITQEINEIVSGSKAEENNE